MKLRILGVFFLGLVGLTVAALLSLSVGSMDLSWGQLLGALLSPQDPGTAHLVVWELRLPRILVAAEVGAALSLAGAAFQSMLRNPLADPYIVGTSAGAALGASVAIVTGLAGLSWGGLSPTPLAAFLGALSAIVAVYRLARRGDGYLPVEAFLLSGVVVSAFLGSMVSLTLSMARQDMPRIVLWLMGSVANARWEHGLLAAPYLVLGALGLFRVSLGLNALTLGEETAASLGVEVERLKVQVVILGALLTSAAVSVAGLIGFVGLVVPHLARKLVGPDHRLLLPASFWLGAAFLVLADALARWLLPGAELPVGIVTALAGAPFFLALMQRRKALL